MKRLALWLIGIFVVVTIGFGIFDRGPSTAAEYARKYGGSRTTYAGILSDTRCERLWDLHLLDVQPGYRIAAADRYNAICAGQ